MTETAKAPGGPWALTGENVACVRGGRLLFSGLGFTVGSGGALLLTGPNGIGKSSLLRIIAGFLAPAAGTLTWPEENGPPAYVGHGDALKPLATVDEMMDYWSALRGWPDDLARADEISRAIEAFALGPLVDMPCRFLSQGQRRRVALARAAASGAALWLLDEPTTSLDESGVRALEAALARHRERGGIAVMASHGGIDPPGAKTLDIARFAGPANAPDAFVAASILEGVA